MNSLEAEYSFLAPTWKLPTVATTSMYSRAYGTSYSTDPLDLGPDLSLWNNTMYNSRYIPTYLPPTITHRTYPVLPNHQRTILSQPQQQQNYQPPGGHPTQSGPPYYQQTNNQYGHNTNSEDGLNLTISLHPNNDYEPLNNIHNHGQSQHRMDNRGLTYSTNGPNNPHPTPGQKRRVQIIDHHRKTPSPLNNDYLSGAHSRNSNQSHSYSHHNHTSDSNKSKPSVSNPYHEHTDEGRYGHNGNHFNIHEYLYGLSEPDPGSYANAFKHHQRRLQDEKASRKSVMSEYQSFSRNGGFGPTFGSTDQRTYGDKVNSEKKKKTYSKVVRQTNQYKFEEQKRAPNNGQHKNRPVPVPKYQRAREYAETIEKPHHLKPVYQTEFPIALPILITSLTNIQHRPSLDSIHSSNQSEFNINRSRRSSSLSSIPTERRVRFRSRDFIRRRSSTIIDLPSHITGKSIYNQTDSLSAPFHEEKPTSKIVNRKNHFVKSSNLSSQQSRSNTNEKKFITSHSMITTKNMRLPPTASVVINQTYKPSFMATTTTNNHFKKSTLNKGTIPSQRPLATRSIPAPFRKSTTIAKTNFDLKIKPFHHMDDDDDNDSFNE